MRKTRKQNKRHRGKTRKGAGLFNFFTGRKSYPPLPPSPPPTPINKRPQVQTGNENLRGVQRFDPEWYKRQRVRVIRRQMKEPSFLNKLLGRKVAANNKAVTLNSEGEAIRSFFPLNRNEKNAFKKNS